VNKVSKLLVIVQNIFPLLPNANLHTSIVIVLAATVSEFENYDAKLQVHHQKEFTAMVQSRHK